jgi:hypothetical protein
MRQAGLLRNSQVIELCRFLQKPPQRSKLPFVGSHVKLQRNSRDYIGSSDPFFM